VIGSLATGALILGGLGLLFGVILAVAHRLLKVEEDPRLEQVEDLLPGSNCGACGEPGCRAFAERLVASDRAPSGCTVSSPEGIVALASFLGVEAGQAHKRVARLHCAGGLGRARQMADYEGYESCAGAALSGGGGKSCAWGCLGLADCDRACTFSAITMSADRLPVVDVHLCTACGDCVQACPKDLFEILPLDMPLLVQCKTPLASDAARALCTVACDACGRCAQDAPQGLITMQNNLPVVAQDLVQLATPVPTVRCPTGAIRWVPIAQFQDRPTALREDAKDAARANPSATRPAAR